LKYLCIYFLLNQLKSQLTEILSVIWVQEKGPSPYQIILLYHIYLELKGLLLKLEKKNLSKLTDL